AFLLPRPIQRAAANAAASVTRHSSIAMLRSNPPPEGRAELAMPSGLDVIAVSPPQHRGYRAPLHGVRPSQDIRVIRPTPTSRSGCQDPAEAAARVVRMSP